MRRIIVLLVFFGPLVSYATSTESSSVVFGFLKKLANSAGENYDYYKNYLGHSTSTTKLHRALSGLRETYCVAKNCSQIKESLAKVFPQVKDAAVYNKAQQHNKEIAYVRNSSYLCPEEEDFRVGRLAHVARALSKIFGTDASGNARDYVPTIGVCASGGGWRAMLATGGFYDELSKPSKSDPSVSVLDTITYASCLSGSSWFTMPRALGIPTDALKAGYLKYGLIPVDFSRKNIQQLKNNPLIIPQKGTFPETFTYGNVTYDKNFFDEQDTLSNAIMRYFIFDIPLSAVTLYGHMIAHIVLSPTDDPEIYNTYVKDAIPKQARQDLLISQAADYLASNNYSNFPLPIGTMVSPLSSSVARQQKTTRDPYIWAEVTPYETGFDYYASGKLTGVYVPTWGTGRRYAQLSADGEKQWWLAFWKRNEQTRYGSTNFAPEPSLGSFLGIFGSAFTFSMEDLGRMMFNFDVHAGGMKGMAAMVVDLMGKIPPITPFGMALYVMTPGKKTRVFPAELPNYGVTPDSPLYGQNLWTVADAGLAGNLPFWPLLKPERHVDIIIALDAGSDAVQGSSALAQAESLARERRIPFPKITTSAKYAERNKRWVTVFDEYEDGNSGPIVLYCPLIDNPEGVAGDFSIAQCLSEDCSTFNFKYSKENAEGVWNLAQNIAHALYPHLQEAVARSVKGETKPVMHSYLGRQWLKLKKKMAVYMPKLRIDRVKA